MKALFLNSDFLLQSELLARLIIAVICGGAIGYERKNRGKGAGIRTHIIVSIASCLMMILSQYGFTDFLSLVAGKGIDIRLDPSRIASQIVSGVGFLGAGMIFVQKKTVTGLTTAAGIWATAGIGMAVGSGMYFIAIACTTIIVIIQIILHKNFKFLRMQNEEEISFVIEKDEAVISFIKKLLQEEGISIQTMNYKHTAENKTELKLIVHFPNETDKLQLCDVLRKNEKIESIKF